MRSRGHQWAIPVILLFLVAAKQGPPRLVDEWTNPDVDRERFTKVMVVGITDDRQARHHFEDKFVSHLRSRNIQAVTSHTLVPDLADIEAEDDIHREIASQKIDAVITVRLVALDKTNESAWPDAWRKELDSDTTAREMIEASLPVAERKSPKYGVEVTLWEMATGARVWSGRSGVFPRKMLKKGKASPFIEGVMNALYDTRLL